MAHQELKITPIFLLRGRGNTYLSFQTNVLISAHLFLITLIMGLMKFLILDISIYSWSKLVIGSRDKNSS